MTASDIRYGRRGGRWAPTRTGDAPDLCLTCRNATARWFAERDGETWPVCGRCRDQGGRLGAGVTYTPIDTEAPGEGVA